VLWADYLLIDIAALKGMDQWKDYFDTLLYNYPNDTDEDFVNSFGIAENREGVPERDIDEVRLKEKKRKAPDVDNIRAEDIEV